MTNILEKLKKLFPLSFAFSKNIGKLLLGAIIYLAIETVAGIVISILSFMISIPVIILAIPYVGWLLAILLFTLLLPVGIILVVLYIALDLALTYALTLVSLYVKAGIIVSIIAYVTGKDEEPAVEEAAADEFAEIAE